MTKRRAQQNGKVGKTPQANNPSLTTTLLPQPPMFSLANSQLLAENERLRSALSLARTETQDLRRDLSNHNLILQETVTTLKAQHAAIGQELTNNLIATSRNFTMQLRQVAAELTKTQNKNVELESQVDETRSENFRVLAENEQLRQETSALQEETAALRELITEIKAANVELNGKIAALEASNATLKATMGEIMRALDARQLFCAFEQWIVIEVMGSKRRAKSYGIRTWLQLRGSKEPDVKNDLAAFYAKFSVSEKDLDLIPEFKESTNVAHPDSLVSTLEGLLGDSDSDDDSDDGEEDADAVKRLEERRASRQRLIALKNKLFEKHRVSNPAVQPLNRIANSC
eukprot:c10396_g1_i1.p1 GENE.c10396_g1_i1~~c10396_g1_i1.p1  ORF type:complete len:358 (+),score=66.87 c10396_g1_i1:40-1074(+)